MADQLLEHLPHMVEGEDAVIRFLKELERVLEPGGRAYIGTPYALSENDLGRIVHYRHFTPTSFKFLDPESAEGEGQCIRYQAGLTRLRLVRLFVLRSIRLTRWFDSSYHFRKYLSFNPNIGRRHDLVAIVQKDTSPR